MRGWGRGQLSLWAASPTPLPYTQEVVLCRNWGNISMIFFIRAIWLLSSGTADVGSSSAKCGEMPSPCLADISLLSWKTKPAWIWSCTTCFKWNFFSRAPEVPSNPNPSVTDFDVGLQMSWLCLRQVHCGMPWTIIALCSLMVKNVTLIFAIV